MPRGGATGREEPLRDIGRNGRRTRLPSLAGDRDLERRAVDTHGLNPSATKRTALRALGLYFGTSLLPWH